MIRGAGGLGLALILLLAADGAAAQTLPGGGAGARQRAAWLRYLGARQLVAEGYDKEDSRLIDQAIGALRETIELDPAAVEPHLDLAQLYLFTVNAPELAEKEAREAIRLAPDNPDGYLILARLAYLNLRRQEESGDPATRRDQAEQARRAYLKVAALDPRQAEAWLMLQSLYEAAQQFDEQLGALEKLLAAPPVGDENVFVQRMISPPFTPDRALFKLSLLYLLRGRGEEALAAARHAYEANPESESYAENLYEVLGWVASREEAVRILGLLPGMTESPGGRLRYAEVLIKAGREEEALTILIGLKDGDPVARATVMAVAQRRLNRRAPAVETLRAAIASAPEAARPGLRLELAGTFEEMGRDAAALQQYELAFTRLLQGGSTGAETDPLFSQTVERQARLLRRTGNQIGLRSLLTRSRRVVDEHSTLLDLLAVEELSEAGRPAEALTIVRAAARRNPNERLWTFNEASLLADLRQFDESVHLLEGLLIGTPESADEDCDLHLQLSFIRTEQGDLPKALVEAREALRLASGNGYLRDQRTSARLQLASIRHREGASAESEGYLREILREDPVNPTALNNLGYFLVERGERLEEAHRLIERAAAIEPLNASFLDSLGWVLFKLGQLEPARIQLERALRLAPRSAANREHLGEVLEALGRRVEARRQWQKALEYAVDEPQRARLRSRLK